MDLQSNISLYGYDLLGDGGADGVRYAWKSEFASSLLESAAFPQKTKGCNDLICGYTTSVSFGCILKTFGRACKFCRTGKVIPFGGFLTALDIAKQNVLMVLADMNCQDHERIRNSKREFAYMGQGEPGYSYTQIKQAIKITDAAMKKLGQVVHRHIIATSGIVEMIKAYKYDTKNKYFDSKITMHFSLHAMRERNIIMPINALYPYRIVLDSLEGIESISGEKPCIGIMLFNNFVPIGIDIAYSNYQDELKYILSNLDPEKFRLSFCEYNDSPDVGTSCIYSLTTSEEIIQMALDRGFDAKLFSSFGKKEKTACGMLGGSQPSKLVKKKWQKLEVYADELISNCEY